MLDLGSGKSAVGASYMLRLLIIQTEHQRIVGNLGAQSLSFLPTYLFNVFDRGSGANTMWRVSGGITLRLGPSPRPCGSNPIVGG